MKPATIILILGLIAPLIAGAQDAPSLEQMRAAAERGNADAQLEMGILYEFGFNMPKNDVNALAWYLRAADQGNELAVKRRDTIQSGMKPDEIEAAQRLAQEMAALSPPVAAPAPAPEPAVNEPAPAPAANEPPVAEVPLAGPPNLDKPSSAP